MKNIIFICCLFFSTFIWSKAEKYVFTTAQLLTINGQTFLGIQTKNAPKWHTYWKNPGDAGLPLKFIFKEQQNNIQFHEMEWPVPQRFIEQGDIIAYGYEGINNFFFGITEDQINQLKNKEVALSITYLVCKDICIPGKNEMTFKIQDKNKVIFKGYDYEATRESFLEGFNQLPQLTEDKSEFYLTKSNEDKKLILNFSINHVEKDHLPENSNVVYPFPILPFGFKKEEIFYDAQEKTLYGKFMVDWDGEYQDPAIELPINGKFQKPYHFNFLINFKNQKPILVQKSISDFSITGAKELETFFNNLKKNTHVEKSEASQEAQSHSIIWYILFAFLGGLILNIMPCVLPVISLKLFSLSTHADEAPQKILRHNLFYTFGVLITMLTLATTVLILKSAGENVGWGFQLQSPTFVFVMMIVLLVLTFNLFGLFEFVTPGGKTLGDKQLKSGVLGDIASGIIATILSTPCSAPFLGTALTFAFTTNHFNIFLIFLFIGLGLSFPFLLTAIFPQLIKKLPRPGLWMEQVKKVLGLSLLLTFIWLYDVFSHLIDFEFYGLWINTFFVTLFFGFYTKKHYNKFFHFLFSFIPLLILIKLFTMDTFTVAESQPETIITSKNAVWKPWTKNIIDDLKTNKQAAFIDFTAKWCLTCKVNKKLVLDTADFYKMANENQLVLITADWTKRDEDITQFLNQNNLAGVPAYFVLTSKGELKFIGETVSIKKIKENL